MKKFSNCRILEILNDIMRHNTENYQSDFEYDKKTIFDAAYSPYPYDRNLLWISRRNGTNCYSEREVFVTGTSAHNTCIFYGEMTHEPIIAYAVEIVGVEEGHIIGNLYELDQTSFYRTVKEKSLPAHHVLLIYKNYISTIQYEQGWGGKIDYDQLQRTVILPADLKKWDETVKAIQEVRRNETYSEWSFYNLKNSFSEQRKSEIEM